MMHFIIIDVIWCHQYLILVTAECANELLMSIKENESLDGN